MTSSVSSPSTRSKVNLNDYDWQQDVRCRLLLKSLSPLEIEILREVLFSSLSFPLVSISSTLDITPSETLPVLQKFASAGLLSIEGANVSVNKDLRKYFELQAERFDEEFRPGTTFCFSLLKQNVPLHVLPGWYSISKAADLIWEAVIERILQTPEVYEKHLRDLKIDDEIAMKILELYQENPLACIDEKTLDCTGEALEKALLQLEYHFVCYSGYCEGKWMLYPLAEWGEYVAHCAAVQPPAVDEASVTPLCAVPFAFVEAMGALLTGADICAKSAECVQAVKDKIADLRYSDEELQNWLKRPLAERAILLYRHPYNALRRAAKYPKLYTDVAVRSAEKALRIVAHSGWVLFEDFLRALRVPLGDAKPVTLSGTGRRRKFALPEYSEQEKSFVYDVIFERLFQVGVVEIGSAGDKPCFRVTEFGRTII